LGETVYQKPVWQMVKEAVLHLGGRATHKQVKRYIKERYGDVKDVTIQCHFILCAVNHPSRIHYQHNKRPRLANGKYDFLFRPSRGIVEIYDPAKHGVWGISIGPDGKPAVGLVAGSELIEAERIKPPPPTAPELVREVYRLIIRLPRFDHSTPPSVLPRSGIYFLFEAGETVDLDGERVDRIVRVGTHRGDGRFASRIRSHYGNASSLGGHKNTSILRMNVGGCLLRRYFPEDERLGQWMTQGAPSFADVEEMVSKYLREVVTFSCIPIESERDRLELERGLIALLNQYPLGEFSEDWLGRSAVSEKIASSGMWNSHHLNGKPLSGDEFLLLERGAARAMRPEYTSQEWRVGRAGGWMEPKPAPERERVALQGLTLVVVPCGKTKIWQLEPETGPVQAKKAYLGPPFKANREYAEAFGDAWVILSAKYGFVFPEMLLPEDPGDVTFGDKACSELVPVSTLKRQVDLLRLGLYDNVVVLGGNGYREAAAQAFGGTAARLHFPFKGLRQGEMISAARRAVDTKEPFPG